MSDTNTTDEFWMRRALALAGHAAGHGEVPVGAVLVRGEGESAEILGEGWNQPITAQDPSAHAEIVALRRAAASVGNYRLPDTTLYVTIEPCTMCTGALIHARVGRLVFGATEPRAGAVCSHFRLLDTDGVYNHRMRWQQGVLADECSALIAGFFRERRTKEQGASD